jgi:DNA-binding HxlR family transcriptional regulator
MNEEEKRITSLENTVHDLQIRLGKLEQEVASTKVELEATPRKIETGFADQLLNRIEPITEQEVGQGLVAYAGAVRAERGELLWEYERSTQQLLEANTESLAKVFNAIGSEVRLDIVKLLLQKPLTSQQLQETLQLSSSGPLYYHLKELMAAGIISQPSRNTYQVAPQRIIPFLAVLAAGLDLGNI